MDYKRGTRIVMDEDKIRKEGKYDLDKLYQNIVNLVEEEWFTKNVKEWTWIDRKEGDTDLIESCKKSNEGIWA